MLSWSRDLLDRADPDRTSVVDVGCGESVMVDALLIDGWQRITLLDISAVALDRVRSRLGSEVADTGSGASLHSGGSRLTFTACDVLAWQPVETYSAWHDRAVLHFLTDDAERKSYVALASRAVRSGGGLVLGGFAPDGPDTCSGLPVARRSPAQLADEFGADFRLEESWRHVHATPWGAEQVFTWVLLRRR